MWKLLTRVVNAAEMRTIITWFVASAVLQGLTLALMIPFLRALYSRSQFLTAWLIAVVLMGVSTVVVDTTAVSKVVQETNSLTYRGYPVQELAATKTFEEVAYLLWYSELPTPDQLAEFTATERAHRVLDSAGMVEAILLVAGAENPYAGLTLASAQGGDAAYRDLWRTVRAARVAAVNAVCRDELRGAF